jgi:hypothetical protein
LLLPLEELRSFLWSDREFLLVSDGGTDQGLGYYGWRLAIADGPVLAENHGPAFGDSEFMHSFRAEGFGQASIGRFFARLLEYNDLALETFIPPVTSVCDNQGLLRRFEQMSSPVPYPNSSLRTDSDVCLLAMDVFSRLPTWRRQHVHGHQDDLMDDLDQLALLNVQADALATQQRRSMQRAAESVPPAPAVRAQLSISGRCITTRPSLYLRHAARSQPLREYLEKRFDWTSSVADSIAWHTFSKAILRLDPPTLQVVQKFNVRWLPTCHRDTSCETSGCPNSACSCSVEDNDHVVRCPGRHSTRESFLANYRSFLRTAKTDPRILSVFVAGLRHFLAG